VHASYEALTLHPSLTLLARWECLKRHSVGERKGELGADFTYVVLLSCQAFDAGLAGSRTAAQAPTLHSGTPFALILHENLQTSWTRLPVPSNRKSPVEILMVEVCEDGMLDLEKRPDRSY
jgi:hypothetical protein